MHIKLKYFVLLKQEEHMCSSSFRHSAPKDQNKQCAHEKNRKRAELWVKINVGNAYIAGETRTFPRRRQRKTSSTRQMNVMMKLFYAFCKIYDATNKSPTTNNYEARETPQTY